MSSQLFVNPWPRGVDDTLHSLVLSGSVLLAGSAVATGEPINWNSIISAISYNETNFLGAGTKYNTGSAYVTTFAASGGTVTATANNNYTPGQPVTFEGNTSALGLLLNGVTVTVVTASATQFTFLSGATGSGSSETGFSYSGKPYHLLASRGAKLTAPVTSLAVSGGIITVTAANYFLPGASVSFSGLSTAIGLLMNGLTFTVIASTGTAFTIASSLTGSAGADAGTATGHNAPQPYSVRFWSEGGSGYEYQYDQLRGTLFALAQGAAANDPLAPITAGAYPSAILGDVIKYEAKWARGV